MDAFGWASGLAIQPDGKILVDTGDHADIYGHKSGILLRFNPDGTPDESFASQGQFRFDSQEFGGPILLQPDGKLIQVLEKGDYARPHSPDLTLLRLNSDGSVDKSFGLDGRSSSRWHGQSYWDKFFIQPDGKILAIENDGIVARFTSTGAGATTTEKDIASAGDKAIEKGVELQVERLPEDQSLTELLRKRNEARASQLIPRWPLLIAHDEERRVGERLVPPAPSEAHLHPVEAADGRSAQTCACGSRGVTRHRLGHRHS